MDGTTSSPPLGSYVHDKRLVEKRTTVPCEVKVYTMRVPRQAAAWPEQAERETQWLSSGAAIAAVSEGGLKVIIAAYAGVGEENDSSGSKPKIKRR